MDIKLIVMKIFPYDYVKLQINGFLYNALEDGWTITKNENNYYVFIKKHEGKKEVFQIHIFIDL